jgi:hypothetical protein
MLKNLFSVALLLFGLRAQPGSPCVDDDDDGRFCDSYENENYLGIVTGTLLIVEALFMIYIQCVYPKLFVDAE